MCLIIMVTVTRCTVHIHVHAFTPPTVYCLFDLNEMFDLLHHFTPKKLTKMKNRPPSAHKELNSVWADGGRFFIFIDFLVVKWCRRSKNENYAKKRSGIVSPPVFSFKTPNLIVRTAQKASAVRETTR